MNQTLDTRIKTAFDEILGHAPDIGETPAVEVVYLSGGARQGGSRVWIGVAAAMLAVVGAGGLIVMTTTRESGRAGEIGASQPAAASADNELARLVADAGSALGWTIAVPADVTASQSSTDRTGINYAEVRIRTQDGNELLVSVRTGDAEAAAAGRTNRDGLLRTIGSATIYIGTDSSHARSVELFDGTTIVYVRSDSLSEATSLNDLSSIAVELNSRWDPRRLDFDVTNTAPTLVTAAVLPSATTTATTTSAVAGPVDPPAMTCGPGGDGTEIASSPSTQMTFSVAATADDSVAIVAALPNGEAKVLACMNAETAQASVANRLSLAVVDPVTDGVLVVLAVPTGSAPRAMDWLTFASGVDSDSAPFTLYVGLIPHDTATISSTSASASEQQLLRFVNEARAEGTMTVSGIGPDILVDR